MLKLFIAVPGLPQGWQALQLQRRLGVGVSLAVFPLRRHTKMGWNTKSLSVSEADWIPKQTSTEKLWFVSSLYKMMQVQTSTISHQV